MDDHDFARQVTKPPSYAGFSTQSGAEYQICMEKLRNANTFTPINLPISETRDNVAMNFMSKTVFCRDFWTNSGCKYGDRCKFAHCLEGMRYMNIMNHNISRRKYCRYSWENCPYAERCIFLHKSLENFEGKRDLLSKDNPVISITPRGGADTRSKTRLCKSWMMLSSCAYGSRCTYAHGAAELRRYTPVLASESGNAWIPSMAVVQDTLPKEVQKSTASKQKLLPKRCSYKWKKTKIVGIYADWIDEESFVPWLASEN